MTEELPANHEESGTATPSEDQGVRRRTITFVLGFIILVFAFLLGYRYALGTSFNTWYLFRVAHDTSFVLDALGESSRMESQEFQRGREEWVRMEIERLRDGRSEITAEESAPTSFAGDALTPWEVWRYRSLKSIDHGVNLQNIGPLIRFKASPNNTFTFRVVPDCGAIPSLSIFAAAVLAFPVPIRRRLAGLIFGMPILYGVNIIRLTTLAFIGAWSGAGEVFRFSHEVVWQGIFIIFVVGVWLLWVEFFVRRRA